MTHTGTPKPFRTRSLKVRLVQCEQSNAELLACCERALNESARVHPDFYAQLIKAIARAKGQP